MTEATWLTCSNPDELLAALDGQSLTTYRKLRLYACACCRSLPGYLESEPDRASLELAELEADGLDGGREFPDEVFDIR